MAPVGRAHKKSNACKSRADRVVSDHSDGFKLDNGKTPV